MANKKVQLGALSGWAARDRRSLFPRRHATVLHYVPLCVPDLPQSRTFGLDSSRPKSGGGHTSVIHTRATRVDRGATGSSLRSYAPSFIDHHRDETTLFDRVTNAPRRSVSSRRVVGRLQETLNSGVAVTHVRTGCASSWILEMVLSREERIAESRRARFWFFIEGQILWDRFTVDDFTRKRGSWWCWIRCEYLLIFAGTFQGVFRRKCTMSI